MLYCFSHGVLLLRHHFVDLIDCRCLVVGAADIRLFITLLLLSTEGLLLRSLMLLLLWLFDDSGYLLFEEVEKLFQDRVVTRKSLQSYFPALPLVVNLELESNSTNLGFRLGFTMFVNRKASAEYFAEAELSLAHGGCDVLLHLYDLERALSGHRAKDAENRLSLHRKRNVQFECRQTRFDRDSCATL